MNYFAIRNVKSQFVLDLKSFKRTSGKDEGEIILFDFHSGNNQLWTYKNLMIFSKKDDRFILEVNEKTNTVQAVKVQASPKPNQKWYFEGNGVVRNGTGLVLDISEGEVEEEVKVAKSHGCGCGCKRQQFEQIPPKK